MLLTARWHGESPVVPPWHRRVGQPLPRGFVGGRKLARCLASAQVMPCRRGYQLGVPVAVQVLPALRRLGVLGQLLGACFAWVSVANPHPLVFTQKDTLVSHRSLVAIGSFIHRPCKKLVLVRMCGDETSRNVMVEGRWGDLANLPDSRRVRLGSLGMRRLPLARVSQRAQPRLSHPRHSLQDATRS